jgi:type III pantothenate kinase
MILCDIGNSYYHFYNKKDNSYLQIDVNLSLESLLKQKIESIFFISVNQKATDKLLFLKSLNKNLKIINLNDSFNLDTDYSNSLGVDRAIICNFINNGIIIDAGSAITIDIVKDGKHLGGTILLGLNAEIIAYKNISLKLDIELNRKVDISKIPTNTVDAISFAIIKSKLEIISQFIGNNQIYFTGGDGKFLSSFFKDSIYDKNLIFKAMENIIKKGKIDD